MCAVVAVIAGCGDSKPVNPPARAADSQEANERHDQAVERALGAMHTAALQGDRGAVARQQQELQRLARADPRPAATSSAEDPFQRMLDDFEFKRAPLFVQQITSSPDRHRIFVGVDRATYCLLAPAARRSAVEDVYGPADRALRAAGVTDLEFVVVPVTGRVAMFGQAFAVGRAKTVRLTQRGRAC